MKKADYEYYLGVVGEDFVGKEKKRFLNREAYDATVIKCVENKATCIGKADIPLLMDYPVERHIGESKIGESCVNGVIFRKKGFDFLESPEDWTVIEPDVTILPSAILYRCDGHYFVERGLLDRRNGTYFKELRQLAQGEYKHLKFEEPVGLFAPEEGDFILYHTYSGGLTLDKIGRLSKEVQRKTIKLVAKAMKELHRNHIIYQQTIPTNM